MNDVNWSRVFASGVLWAVVYNSVWGIAWFAFMRKEWLDAMAVIKQPLPWTTEFWVVWVVVTLPIGVATMAYVASRARFGPAPKAALTAGLAVWVLMTIGMAGWGWQESHSMRLIAIDSTVNLLSIVAASLAGEWILRSRLHRRNAEHQRTAVESRGHNGDTGS